MTINNIELMNLIKDNEGLIYSIINKYIKYYEKEDLYQVAAIGIIKAYNNYNPNAQTKFTTYAYTYILSEVINFVNNSKLIKTSREYHKLYKKILEAKTLLTQRLMKEPTISELSLFLEIDEELINDVLRYQDNIQSLDATIMEDGKKLSLLDKISEQATSINIEDICLKEEINKLSPYDQELIMLRYFEGKTQSEIANFFGTNQVQISRNEQKVLKKLKNNLCESP